MSRFHRVLVLGLALFLGNTTTLAFSQENTLHFDFYALPRCHDCHEFLTETWPHLVEQAQAQGLELVLNEHDILEEEDFQRLKDSLQLQGLSFTGVPVLLGAGTVFQGNELNPEAVLAAISTTTPVLAEEPAASKTEPAIDSTSVLLIVAAGFIDGINPCAFGTLLFLISALGLDRGKRTLAIGLGFTAGVFVAYFLIGLGLLNLAALPFLGPGTETLISFIFALTLGILALLSLRDAWMVHAGRSSEISLKLPRGIHLAIHGIIRPLRHGSLAFFGALGLGALISILEFVCTGQVYLPTLVFMNKQGLQGAWALLGLYNLAFVSPLVGIVMALDRGLRHEKLQLWFKEHLAGTKIMLGVLFLALGLALVFG